ncbi:hypothetical protein TNCV_1894621 [Trichonephila clavipes]|nr:hypothetical protein TNCV_1894621 [Trichonephila clavipes]
MTPYPPIHILKEHQYLVSNLPQENIIHSLEKSAFTHKKPYNKGWERGGWWKDPPSPSRPMFVGLTSPPAVILHGEGSSTGFVPSIPHSGLLQRKECIVIFCYSHASEKKGESGQENRQVKSVEHTRAAEAPGEKRARLQADQVHHSLARAAETPEQYQEEQVRHRNARAAERPIQHVARLLGLRKQKCCHHFEMESSNAMAPCTTQDMTKKATIFFTLEECQMLSKV